MDFSKKDKDGQFVITNQKLTDAYNAAVAKEDFVNALTFQNELAKRGAFEAEGVGIVEKGLSKFYGSLAKGFGAPVDIAASGLRKAGVPVGDAPVGGEQSLRGLIDVASGGQAFTDAKPTTTGERVVSKVMDVAGETIPATIGIVGAAPKAVNLGADLFSSFKNILANVRGEAAKNPAKFARDEAAIVTGAGVAAGSIESMFPDNPTAETVAELLGTMGGVAGVKVAESLASRTAAKKANLPFTAAELKRTAGEVYEAQKADGFSAQPEVTQSIMESVFRRADVDGIILPDGSVDPDYTKMSGTMKILEAYADKGMTGAQILSTRRGIKNRMNDAKGSEKNLLRNVLRDFDAHTADLAPSIKVANAMYARAMKAEQIEDLLELAKTRANANVNLENAMRTEFRSLLRRIVKGTELGWTPQEQDHLRRIVEGGTLENMLQFIGKAAPSGSMNVALGGGLPFSLAYSVTGDVPTSGAVAGSVMGAGLLGRMGASKLQQMNVEAMIRDILQGRQVTPEAEGRLRAALTAYLTGQAATQ